MSHLIWLPEHLLKRLPKLFLDNAKHHAKIIESESEQLCDLTILQEATPIFNMERYIDDTRDFVTLLEEKTAILKEDLKDAGRALETLVKLESGSENEG